MKRLATALYRLLHDEDAPTSLEYAIMVSLIAAVVFASASVIGLITSGYLTNFGNVMGGLPGG